MEQKYEAYKRFDWQTNQKWQLYMDNIFPTPTRERIEKMRRKWYRDNIDKEYDLSWEPSTENIG